MKLLLLLTFTITVNLSSAQSWKYLPVSDINGKYGYIDRNNSWILEPQFEQASMFNDKGVAIVKFKGKYGLIDQSFQEVEPFIYDNAYFKTDLRDIITVQKGDKRAYLKSNGELITDFIYDSAAPFNINELGCARVGHEYMLISHTGNIIVSGLSKARKVENENLYLIRKKDGLVTIVDEKGKPIIPIGYARISGSIFSKENGRLIVSDDSKTYYMVDFNGKVISNKKYKRIGSISKDGKCYAITLDRKSTILNINGDELISPLDFNPSIPNNTWYEVGAISSNQLRIMECKPNTPSKGQYILDALDNMIVECNEEDSYFSSYSLLTFNDKLLVKNYFSFSKITKRGVKNRYNKYIIDPIYKYIFETKYPDLYKVGFGKQSGFIDTKNNILFGFTKEDVYFEYQKSLNNEISKILERHSEQLREIQQELKFLKDKVSSN